VAYRQEQGVWFGFGVIELSFWLAGVPTMLGTGVGYWFDGGHVAGYTLTLLIASILFGCMNAFFFVALDAIVNSEKVKDEE
jgi:predicted F0F1-ATPase subunit